MADNKKNLIVRLQHWMESVAGQTFLNYAYSWGAAVVILGTLFKLTHISGADIMLFVGMGTEVFVFFLSGFDRPAELKEAEDANREGAEKVRSAGAVTVPASSNGEPAQVIPAQPAVVINGPAYVQDTMPGSQGTPSAEPVQVPAVDMKLLAEMINASNAEFLKAARNTCAPEMEEAAQAYVDELKKLTDVLNRVSEQAECMTRDSKEMDNLNRTLTGINTIYEMQLKSISTQVGTIDQINEQTRRMARQIEDLNGIYSRMIKALTVNMKNAAGNASVE